MATRDWLSRSVRDLAVVAVVLCTLATAYWVALVAEGKRSWGAFAFVMLAGHLGAACLFLVVLPGAILYRKARRKRDLWSLCLGGCSFLVLLADIVLLMGVIPRRGE